MEKKSPDKKKLSLQKLWLATNIYILTCNMESIHPWKVLSKYSFLTDSSIPLKSDRNTMTPVTNTQTAKGYQQKLQSSRKTAMTNVKLVFGLVCCIKRHSKKHIQKYIWPEIKGVQELWGSSSEKLLQYATIWKNRKFTISSSFFQLFKIACIVKIESNGRVEVNILSLTFKSPIQWRNSYVLLCKMDTCLLIDYSWIPCLWDSASYICTVTIKTQCIVYHTDDIHTIKSYK